MDCIVASITKFKPKYTDVWASFSYTVDMFDTLENLGFCRSYVHDVSGHTGPSLIVEGNPYFKEKAWYWNKASKKNVATSTVRKNFLRATKNTR